MDSGRFNWNAHADKFPGLTTPDESYHGVCIPSSFGLEGAYITKATAQLMRDLGSIQSPQNAFLINLGLESLHLRMARHAANGRAVAEHLGEPPEGGLGAPSVAGRRLGGGARGEVPAGGSCGVVSFGVAGGRAAAETFMKNLKLAQIATHVADARTCVLHPGQRHPSPDERRGA